jgi:hypothetical protein
MHAAAEGCCVGLGRGAVRLVSTPRGGGHFSMLNEQVRLRV